MTMNRDNVTTLSQAQLYGRFWQAASGFWSGRSRWTAYASTISLVLLIIVQLIVQYRLNFWTRDFFDALQQKNGTQLWRQALLFVPLAASSVGLSIISIWGRMAAQRKWRAWLTTFMIDYWLGDDRFRRLNQVQGNHQNPEFRIAEDARIATDAPIDLALGLLTSLMTAAVFIQVLWQVGGHLTIDVFAMSLTVPGYLVVAVIGYAVLFTSAMRAIGSHLTHVIEGKNQAEAEFLSAATRWREAGELSAPPASVERERRTLASTLANVLEYWLDLSKQLMRIALVSQGNILLAPVVGWVLCTPKFLAGTMTLGELTQAAAAFVTVQGAFNWLVDNYQRFSDWTSSVNRVSALLIALDEVVRRDETSGLAGAAGADEPPRSTTQRPILPGPGQSFNSTGTDTVSSGERNVGAT